MKIKFLSWNVWYGKRWQKAIKLIGKLQPDILALQEVTTFFPYFDLENTNILEKFQKAIPLLKYSSFAPILKRERGGKFEQLGNAIFSRYKILETNIFYFHHPPRWGRRWWNNQAKNLLEAKIKIDGKELFVYSTHLSLNPLLLDTKKRIEEAEKIIKVVKEKKPLIIGGDFNGRPNSLVVQRLKGAFRRADPKNRPTFAKLSLSAGRLKIKGISLKLDYVFYSPQLKIRTCHILKTDASDHLPIVVEFEI